MALASSDSSTLDTAAAGAPSTSSERASQVVEHFFRHESGRLHGALMRRLGTGNISLVEDVAQAALLQAMRTWSIGGVPPNPSAWITRVAINLALDAVRHQRMASEKESAILTHFEQLAPDLGSATDTELEMREDVLRLMFVCCHPSLAGDAQVVLALKVLCGFSTTEIARAFLSTDAAIEKQLTRTKQRIRDEQIGFAIPEPQELGTRLDGVLSTLYLLFNEGYKASAGDRLLREELCHEAIRLMSFLVSHPAGNKPHAHALLALMLLSAARFPARIDADGVLLRLDDQDRSKWDQALIARGLVELVLAAKGEEVSEYHLQAGIAACHCTAADYASTDWKRILRHYDALHRLKPSPVVALNRAVALANVEGPRAGLDAITGMPQRDRMESHYLYHAVIGELHWRMNDHREAAESYRRALQLALVGPEQLYLSRMLDRNSDVQIAALNPTLRGRNERGT